MLRGMVKPYYYAALGSQFLKSAFEPENSQAAWRRSPCRSSRSPGRYSRSPSGSRSRSADLHVGIADK
ncbi:hypothetical protein Gotur_020542 [Gossypium turneri]